MIENGGLVYLSNKLNELAPKCLKEPENEMLSEVITEIITIIWKVFQRSLGSKIDSKALINEKLLNDLQLLLGSKHGLLLRCVLESLLTFFDRYLLHLL